MDWSMWLSLCWLAFTIGVFVGVEMRKRQEARELETIMAGVAANRRAHGIEE